LRADHRAAVGRRRGLGGRLGLLLRRRVGLLGAGALGLGDLRHGPLGESGVVGRLRLFGDRRLDRGLLDLGLRGRGDLRLGLGGLRLDGGLLEGRLVDDLGLDLVVLRRVLGRAHRFLPVSACPR
jgi:hypothetical protein